MQTAEPPFGRAQSQNIITSIRWRQTCGLVRGPFFKLTLVMVSLTVCHWIPKMGRAENMIFQQRVPAPSADLHHCWLLLLRLLNYSGSVQPGMPPGPHYLQQSAPRTAVSDRISVIKPLFLLVSEMRMHVYFLPPHTASVTEMWPGSNISVNCAPLQLKVCTEEALFPLDRMKGGLIRDGSSRRALSHKISGELKTLDPKIPTATSRRQWARSEKTNEAQWSVSELMHTLEMTITDH